MFNTGQIHIWPDLKIVWHPVGAIISMQCNSYGGHLSCNTCEYHLIDSEKLVNSLHKHIVNKILKIYQYIDKTKSQDKEFELVMFYAIGSAM